MHFEPGDLLLFYGRDFSSRVIEWATRGPSHVGIVCPHPPGREGEERRETLALPPDSFTSQIVTHCDDALPKVLPSPPRGRGAGGEGGGVNNASNPESERENPLTPNPSPARGEGDKKI